MSGTDFKVPPPYFAEAIRDACTDTPITDDQIETAWYYLLHSGQYRQEHLVADTRRYRHVLVLDLGAVPA